VSLIETNEAMGEEKRETSNGVRAHARLTTLRIMRAQA
jgi:hypothetical protein